MAASGRATLVPNQPPVPLPYAGLQLRIVAFILDIIVLISFFMLFVAAGGLQAAVRSDFFEIDPPESAFYIWAGFVIAFVPFSVLYFALLWAWRGQTVGMMAVHIKVVRRDGARLSFGRALARTLLLLPSLLPLALGLATAVFDGRNRALHDYLAGTVVLELP